MSEGLIVDQFSAKQSRHSLALVLHPARDRVFTGKEVLTTLFTRGAMCK
jgi:hypothetical protein